METIRCAKVRAPRELAGCSSRMRVLFTMAVQRGFARVVGGIACGSRDVRSDEAMLWMWGGGCLTMRASRVSLMAIVFALLPSGRVAAEPVYFLVAGLPGAGQPLDSYVLPLDNPVAIEHARELVNEGPSAGSTIVVAKFAVGGDGINRNYLSPSLPPWSWHVTEFVEFAEVTIELCDGSPTLVEQDVQTWFDNTNGTLCFWNYTVVAEFTPVPEPSTLALLAIGVVFSLSAAGRRRPCS